MIWNKTQQMDWTSKRQFLLGFLHSHNNFDINTLNLNLHNTSWPIMSDFNYEMQNLIDIVNDNEILFKHGIDLNERVHHIDNNILSHKDIIHGEFDYYKHLAVWDDSFHLNIRSIIWKIIRSFYRDGIYAASIMLDIIEVNKYMNKLVLKLVFT